MLPLFKEKKHLLIVESHDVLRSHLHHYFASHHYRVTSIASEEKIIPTLSTLPINVMVLSLTNASRHVFCLLEQLRHDYPQIQLIVTTQENWAQSNARVQLLEKGATDVVIKPFQCKELLLRINNILPFPVTAPDHYQTGDLVLYANSHCIVKTGKKIQLTGIETELLKLLYQHIDQVVTRDEITQQLYGIEYHPLNRRIDIHINKIRKKIEDKPSQPSYIQTVRGQGYYLKSLPFVPQKPAPLAKHHAIH